MTYLDLYIFLLDVRIRKDVRLHKLLHVTSHSVWIFLVQIHFPLPAYSLCGMNPRSHQSSQTCQTANMMANDNHLSTLNLKTRNNQYIIKIDYV